MKLNKHNVKSQKITNKRFYVYALLFATFVITAILCFVTDDFDIGVLLIALSILFLIILLFTPQFFVFDSKQLSVHSLLCRKNIHYAEITSILESKLFESYDNVPKYEIMFLTRYKGKQVVKQIDLPRNKKNKKEIESRLKGKLIR